VAGAERTASEPGRSPDVSVIIPTYNEAVNLPDLVTRLFRAFEKADLAGELVVADDESPDGTADLGERLLEGRGRVLRRTGPRGLALAVMDGFAAARSDILCVMDADLSHPPEVVPALVRAVMAGAGLAVGSRYVPGGGVEGWPLKRKLLSRIACAMAWPLTRIRDATSGFFCLRRSVLASLAIAPEGFKIGLEVFVRGMYTKGVEIPYTFRDRQGGESKLGSGVMSAYARQLLRLADFRIAHPV
jgi:dolichol-phosphate mannosyltransferase